MSSAMGRVLTPTDHARELLTHTIEDNPYIPHAPTTRQALFLACMVREAFYGGAAGGGKSDALLMAAVQFIDVPGYNALLLRRTYADLSLPGAIMDRSHEWWDGTAARWHRHDKRWDFPSGARVSFGFLATDADLERYRGAEFQFCGLDESTQFTGKQILFLFSRLRRLSGSNIPIRLRNGSNPGGIGHEWHKERYLNPLTQRERPFFPAKLLDNPYLDQKEYTRSLENLDPVTRAQLLEGDWNARFDGGLFRREWFTPIDALPDQANRVRYWDLAATKQTGSSDPDWTVGVRVSRDRQGLWTIEDVRRIRGTPAEVENLMRQTAELDGTSVRIFIEQEPGASGKIVTDRFIREVLVGYAVYAVRATGPKLERAKPYSAQVNAGNVRILRSTWNTAFYDEHEAFPLGAHDDQVDAASGAFAQLAVKTTGEIIVGGTRAPVKLTLQAIR
jgi:predicted phage terminase large subunit-like protein